MIPALVCVLVFVLMAVYGYVDAAKLRGRLLVTVAVGLMLSVLLDLTRDLDLFRQWQPVAYLLSFVLGTFAGGVAARVAEDNRS